MPERTTAEVDVLYEILGDTADVTGEEYFDRLVKSVTSALDVRVSFVSLFTEDREQMRLLSFWDWPGNVRELENVVERALILAQGGPIEPGYLMLAPAAASGGGFESLRESEKRHIVRALDRAAWKVSGPGGAAELLDVNPSTLDSRMRKLGIKRPGRPESRSDRV